MQVILANPRRSNVLAQVDKKLRPKSNLVQDPRFALPPAETKSGFLYFYTNSVAKPIQSYASLFVLVGSPQLAQHRPSPTTFKKYRVAFNAINENWTKLAPASLVSVKKNSTTFTIKVPLMVVPNPVALNIYEQLANAFAVKDGETALTKEQLFPTGDASVFNQVVTAEQLPSSNGLFSAKHVLQLKKANAEFEFKPLGDNLVLIATFELSKEQCQYMTNTPWMLIRPIDIYGPVFEWVNGRFGLYTNAPKFSIPLTQIASTLPEGGTSRLSDDGILINQDGEILALPAQCNNIAKYDSELTTSLTKSDGSLSYIDISGEASRMPPSQAVFIDWVNLKFAYTGVDGRLKVMGLDRCRPLNISHIKNILNTELTDSNVKFFYSSLSNLAASVLNTPSFPPLPLFAVSIQDAINLAGNDLLLPEDVKLYHIQVVKDKVAAAKDVVTACEALISLAQTNIANLYERYSVMTIARLLAYATVLVKHGVDYDSVVAKDNELRKPYLDQKVDPDYTMPAVPFVASARGFIPHQVKVTNLLRNSPDFALIPVDAGGGKTMLAYTTC